MARAVLVPLCLCWALGLAAASAPPNILLLLMDDVSGTGEPPGDGTLVTGRKSLGGQEGGALGWMEGMLVTREAALSVARKKAVYLSPERGLGSWEGVGVAEGNCGLSSCSALVTGCGLGVLVIGVRAGPWW